jgi:hypothetical protein
MRGSELDITGTAFATLLLEEIQKQGLADSVYLLSPCFIRVF